MLFSLRYLNRRRPAWSALYLFVFGPLIPQVSHALRIDADFVNLADTVQGQDLWQENFHLSLGSFATNEGFTIYFAPILFTDISAPLAPIPAGWDVLSVQPDMVLSAPGFLDGLASVNNPILSQPFSVNFVWHGAGTPLTRIQQFETYTLNGGFAITGSGQAVVSVIPEIGNGGTFGLALIAICALSAGRRRVGNRAAFLPRAGNSQSM